mmetsp:Transcript_56831/g.128795  ORF Transcript_56831/g.128795 Transcript_56831/m.128795 type:complete len:280 (+) Transcript_56831:102-941(+)
MLMSRVSVLILGIVVYGLSPSSAVPSLAKTKRRITVGNKPAHSTAFDVPARTPATVHRKSLVCTRAMNMRGGFSTFSVVPAVGVGVTNAMMLSTIPPILAARHRGSLKRGASVAHLALVFPSCVAWTVFALATKNPYIFLSNGPGVLIGIFLFLSGMRLGSRAQRDQLESFALGSGVLMLGSGAAMGVFGSESNLGALLANCLSILFYLSPIPVLREALRTRSARALQMPMAATSLVNSALWTACKKGCCTALLSIIFETNSRLASLTCSPAAPPYRWP